jgi:hypothetical protein
MSRQQGRSHILSLATPRPPSSCASMASPASTATVVRVPKGMGPAAGGVVNFPEVEHGG